MESERGRIPAMGDKPHEVMPNTSQGAALGETVKAGLARAGALDKDAADKTRDTLADYRGGVEQIAEDIVKYVRSRPIAALLIGTGLGVFVGMLLVLGRTAESGQRSD